MYLPQSDNRDEQLILLSFEQIKFKYLFNAECLEI